MMREITSAGIKFLFLPIVEEYVNGPTAPTQSISSMFITIESIAIPSQTLKSPVSFQ